MFGEFTRLCDGFVRQADPPDHGFEDDENCGIADPVIDLAADDDFAPLWQGWQTKPRWVVPQTMARKRNGDDGAVGLLRFSIGGLGETGEGVTTVNGMSHAPSCHHNAVTSPDYEVNGSAGFEIVRSPVKRMTTTFARFP